MGPRGALAANGATKGHAKSRAGELLAFCMTIHPPPDSLGLLSVRGQKVLVKDSKIHDVLKGK